MGWNSSCNVISTSDLDRSINAIRCFNTVANFLKIKVPPTTIKKIKYILDLNKFSLNNIFARLNEHGITFAQTKEDSEDIFSCNTTTRDMILIVITNYIHKHKAHLSDNPMSSSYIMCSFSFFLLDVHL